MVVPSGSTTLTRARMVGGTGLQSTLTAASMATSVALSPDAGVAGTFDPFNRTPLQGSVSAGTADSVTWVLLSSSNSVVTPLNLVAADPTALVTSYQAPATANGTVLTWRFTAHKAGQADVSDTVVHTIRDHSGPWLWGSSGNANKKPVKMTAVYAPDVNPDALLFDNGVLLDNGSVLGS